MTDDPNGWQEWSKYVLKALEAGDRSRSQLVNAVRELRDDLAIVRADIAVVRAELKIKAGIWAAIGAAIPIIVVLASQLL